jgi:hypothetical protein
MKIRLLYTSVSLNRRANYNYTASFIFCVVQMDTRPTETYVPVISLTVFYIPTKMKYHMNARANKELIFTLRSCVRRKRREMRNLKKEVPRTYLHPDCMHCLPSAVQTQRYPYFNLITSIKPVEFSTVQLHFPLLATISSDNSTI